MARLEQTTVFRFSICIAVACLALLGLTSVARGAQEVRAELISSALTNPVDVGAPPGDPGRLFVVEQRGTIRIIDLATRQVQPVAGAFLDIQGRLASGGEKGLLGLAFHPHYAQNGYFYVATTRAVGVICAQSPPPGCASDQNSEWVLSRFQVSAGDPNRADPNSEKVLLRFCHPYSNHNGGQVAFGPLDGYLYFTVGDGGSGGDPCGSGQSSHTFLGKLLRIDVDGADPYAIPDANPFAHATDGSYPEIWAIGLRNPWRFTFDSASGDLYIADVGQDTWEELDYQAGGDPVGRNYEWNIREANHSYPGVPAFGEGVRTAPILEYPHSGGAYHGKCIIGGMVYRGSLMPDLQGTYFFADNDANWVRSIRYDGVTVNELTDRTAQLNLGIAPDVLDGITSFGADGSGEIYLCDSPSKIFRIVAASPPGPSFLRGDANQDGALDISDGIFSLSHLFGGRVVECIESLDVNDDGKADISDPISLFEWLFSGGPAPRAPYPACGPDPTTDTLPCPASVCI
jgi:glucose/arabinose dehydrogenase